MILIDATRKRKLRSAVLKWYDQHGRRLPWRVSADPYRIWLSEIMLQQTTVAAVVPYFERFVAKFPDVDSLAHANVDDVLRLWEGLGYYSRARNLHKAAMVIQQQHGGEFPANVELLQKMPGIGRYTAGAIASFAFDQPAPIVEANTERLYARLMALTDDVRSSANQRTLWKFAGTIIPRARPGDFNQALMDIGSQLCRPQEPNCEQCPLKTCCAAFAQGIQNELPHRKP
ncbi:MAG: A/G-specific adenine glycosylase, partial [Planctomycetota bacterium]|nr:A/G-specific adenine glycosylase [Planctomycetota bacterium]